MDSSDGRVLILIVVATVVFFIGRRYQRTVDAWGGRGKAIKAAADAKAHQRSSPLSMRRSVSAR
ncbi:hypothetical protein ACFFMN_41620 [Planobispora siamensis]|uniref:Uncharacterized protein n=1 Tax=Planobispora siamensis TaxID=936338 RepID=A0A8J3SQZ6_9ACTN|nr:hypothetical protein [Planobispora siamensis]GIH97221.1 hypothetical protein Psi01_78510 [Planobispora siamensis]